MTIFANISDCINQYDSIDLYFHIVISIKTSFTVNCVSLETIFLKTLIKESLALIQTQKANSQRLNIS